MLLISSLSLFTMSNLLNAMPQVASAKEIKAQEEKKYAQELKAMEKRNPAKDAQAAKSLGFPYLLAHYAGRSSSLIIPGIDNQHLKTAQQRCPILIMDGLGDMVYGKQHMAYRKASTDYAVAFNKVTYKACMASTPST